MKTIKENIIIFKQGFTLLSKNLYLFLIILVFSLIAVVLRFIIPTYFGFVNILLSACVSLLSWGFKLAIPVFLINYQNKKKPDFNFIKKEIIETVIRMIGPIILVGLLFYFFIGISTMVVTVFLTIGDKISLGNIDKQILNFILNSFLVSLFITYILTSFLSFFPIFFCVEKHRFELSVKESIVYSYRNFPFLAIIILTNFVFAVFIRLVAPVSLLTTGNSLKIWSFISEIINFFPYLLISASTLIYYQKNTKNI